MEDSKPCSNLYRHYKGGIYRLEDFNVTWAGNEPAAGRLVVYVDVSTGRRYARPFREFFEEVEVGKPRFERLKDNA